MHLGLPEAASRGSVVAEDRLGVELLVAGRQVEVVAEEDGRAVAARMGDIDPWLGEWLSSEQTFVDRVVSKLPPTPPNFTRIVELNELGDAAVGDPTDLEAGANRCAVA